MYYEQLVSALRNNADHYGFVGDNSLDHLLTDAADAIEHLKSTVKKIEFKAEAYRMERDEYLQQSQMFYESWQDALERLSDEKGGQKNEEH